MPQGERFLRALYPERYAREEYLVRRFQVMRAMLRHGIPLELIRRILNESTRGERAYGRAPVRGRRS